MLACLRPYREAFQRPKPPICVLKRQRSSSLGPVVPAEWELRSLIRALLRECTYLPDSAARGFMHAYVVIRCQRYPQESTGKPNEIMRRVALFRDGRKLLSTLSRANSGHYDALGRVLELTYGRRGKLRHELMKPLLQPDVPVNASALAELSESDVEKERGRQLTPKMLALVKAQKHQRAATLSRLPIREPFKPEIPEMNAWGRPMPKKRLKNAEKKWYASVLDKVLPPLPEDDWNRLRDLSQGLRPWDGLVAKRPGISGTDVVHDAELAVGHEDNHEITHRFMKRLWTKIFLQCPKMRWDGELGKWRVEWGYLEGISTVAPPLAFLDVDKRGKIIPKSPQAGPSKLFEEIDDGVSIHIDEAKLDALLGAVS